jgi:hypothetical protein
VPQLEAALEAAFPGLATVTNSARGAMWSQWGVENLRTRVLQLPTPPDVFFVEFGLNDAVTYAWHGSEAGRDDGSTYAPCPSPAVARANLKYMLDRLAGSHPLCE